MKDATAEQTAMIEGILDQWAEAEPLKGSYGLEYASVTRDDPGYLVTYIDVYGCPSEDEFLSRGKGLACASLTPSGEGSEMYRDTMLVEVDLGDGRTAFFSGELHAPPANDEGSSGHYLGNLVVVDQTHVDEARTTLLDEYDQMIAGETVSDLACLLRRMEHMTPAALTSRHPEFREVADQLNRMLAEAA